MSCTIWIIITILELLIIIGLVIWLIMSLRKKCPECPVCPTYNGIIPNQPYYVYGFGTGMTVITPQNGKLLSQGVINATAMTVTIGPGNNLFLANADATNPTYQQWVFIPTSYGLTIKNVGSGTFIRTNGFATGEPSNTLLLQFGPPGNAFALNPVITNVANAYSFQGSNAFLTSSTVTVPDTVDIANVTVVLASITDTVKPSDYSNAVWLLVQV